VATVGQTKSATTRSDISGLSVSFAIIASGNSADSSREARQRLAWLSGWLPGYLRAVFARERLRWPRAAWIALEEDAAQHLVLAAIQRGPRRWQMITDEHAFNWSKAVVRHFVISEAIRRRARADALSTTLQEATDDSPESCVSLRQSTVRPISLLRTRVSMLVRARDAPSVLQAFDELVLHTLADPRSNSYEGTESAARGRQRRRRTRRLVARAAAQLRSRITDLLEQGEFLAVVAALLGVTPEPHAISPQGEEKISVDVTSQTGSTQGC